MKQGWKIKSLGEIANFSQGIQVGLEKQETKPKDGYVRFIRIVDYTQNTDDIRYIPNPGENYFVNEEDIVMVRYGTPGLIGRGKAGVIANNLFRIKIEIENLTNDYLSLYLSQDNIQKYLSTQGSATMPALNFGHLKKVEIKFPALTEQQRIVALLNEAFAAIAKAKANAEQNLKNARELFESYLHKLFLQLFNVSEKKTISSIAKIIGGYSFKSTDFKKEGQYQVIRMGNVRPGIIREEESPVFIDKMEEKAFAKALLLPNDVIITQTGTKKKRDYGFTTIIEKENYLLNQRIASIRFSEKYLPKFFLYFSWTNIFKDQYFANETGTVGQGNVGIGAISYSLVPFLPLTEQQKIVQKLDEILAYTKRLEAIYQQKLNDLEELKKSILQKAFNGELKTA